MAFVQNCYAYNETAHFYLEQCSFIVVLVFFSFTSQIIGNSLKKRAEDAFADPDWTQVHFQVMVCFVFHTLCECVKGQFDN